MQSVCLLSGVRYLTGPVHCCGQMGSNNKSGLRYLKICMIEDLKAKHCLLGGHRFSAVCLDLIVLDLFICFLSLGGSFIWMIAPGLLLSLDGLVQLDMMPLANVCHVYMHAPYVCMLCIHVCHVYMWIP